MYFYYYNDNIHTLRQLYSQPKDWKTGYHEHLWEGEPEPKDLNRIAKINNEYIK